MARTTIDDCLEQCPNHFELSYRAARRARDIMNRGDPRVPDQGDKSIVVALREIADPHALADQMPSEAAAEAEAAATEGMATGTEAAPAEEFTEAASFGAIPPSPDEPDPTDPMGERERARFSPPPSPDEPEPEHIG